MEKYIIRKRRLLVEKVKLIGILKRKFNFSAVYSAINKSRRVEE